MSERANEIHKREIQPAESAGRNMYSRNENHDHQAVPGSASRLHSYIPYPARSSISAPTLLTQSECDGANSHDAAE